MTLAYHKKKLNMSCCVLWCPLVAESANKQKGKARLCLTEDCVPVALGLMICNLHVHSVLLKQRSFESSCTTFLAQLLAAVHSNDASVIQGTSTQQAIAQDIVGALLPFTHVALRSAMIQICSKHTS